MIIVTGIILTDPKNRAAIEAESIAHCRRSRAEPGCLGHNVHFDCENRDRLVFVEYWSDAKSLRTHFVVPASHQFIQVLGQLSDQKPEMQIFRAEQISPDALTD